MSELKRSNSFDEIEAKRVKVEPKGLTEADVGISQFVNSDISGFEGSIKQRYTDFLVNEINSNGEVLKFDNDGLGDLSRFKKKKKEEEPKEEPKEEAKEIKTEFVLTEEESNELLNYFPQSDIDKLIELANFKTQKYESNVKFESKEERTKIHQLIRKNFKSKLESRTSENDTFQFQIINKASRKPSNRISLEDTLDENGVENYGLGPLKKFVNFNLYKQNKDTMEATNIIARMLKIPPKEIRIAGTKDRRAVTVQKCSIPKIRVERLNTLNKGLKGNIKIGSFTYSDEGVRLGDLSGNEFTVVIKDVQIFSQNLEEEINKLSNNGFINYFGMQRFGTFSISTHEIGKEILLENWENAVNLILKDQELAIPDSKESRTIWENSKDAVKASSLMPRKCLAESIVLETLSKLQSQRTSEDGEIQFKESDYFNSINRIPRNLKIMYGHAYQSYIWNSIASIRFKKYGNDLQVGDLIIDENIVEETDEDIRIDKFQRSRELTQEDIDSGKYSIFDIVLPLPGFDVNYPKNLIEGYKKIMEKDGLDPEAMVRKVKDFSFSGSYRRLITKPKELKFFKKNYKNSTDSIINTDLDILDAKKKGIELKRIKDDIEGDKLAIVLQFQLDTSSYATMMLREIMRMDTGRHGELCDVKVETTLE